MAHYPTCHDEKIWRKKILPDARLPRLSGDEHIPVIDVCLHGCMCVCVCVFMHAYEECVYVEFASICVYVLLLLCVCVQKGIVDSLASRTI